MCSKIPQYQGRVKSVGHDLANGPFASQKLRGTRQRSASESGRRTVWSLLQLGCCIGVIWEIGINHASLSSMLVLHAAEATDSRQVILGAASGSLAYTLYRCGQRAVSSILVLEALRTIGWLGLSSCPFNMSPR